MIENVIQETAKHFNLNAKDIKGLSRKRKYVNPRSMIVAYLRTKYKKTYKEIGQIMSKRSHTTLINALSQHYALFKTDPTYRKNYNSLCEHLDLSCNNNINLQPIYGNMYVSIA